MDEACTLLLSYRVLGARVGGAGLSPAVLRRDGRAKIASETLAPPNPALRSKVSGHRAQRIRGGLPLSEGRRNRIGHLRSPLQVRPVPLTEVGGCLVCALTKFEQRIPG